MFKPIIEIIAINQYSALAVTAKPYGTNFASKSFVSDCFGG
jgi:hypothetical protein